MADLSQLRTQIDEIDSQLLDLLNRRLELVAEIGEIKNREGLPIYAPEREERLLRSLVSRCQGGLLKPEAVRAIYREIMSASLALEKDIWIACHGPGGGASHRAAVQKFGSSVRYAFCDDIAAVFQAVAEDRADCGVVPIDDHSAGIVSATLDQLAQSELTICAEIYLSDNASDTANAPADRFLVMGRSPNPPSGEDRTMLLLRIEDKPGALVAALEPFKEFGINLSHFASRPAAFGSQDLLFFVEADGHSKDMQLADLFRELSKRCRAVKVLGSYPNVPKSVSH
jgi:chorismate mutase/prephenate dehydratase